MATKLITLEMLLIDTLKDLFDAEKQITKTLPKLIKTAEDQKLKTALTDHLEETNNQIKRLEEIFDELDAPVRGKKSEAMKGILEQGKTMIDQDFADGVADVAIIAAASAVEHYEMADYMSAKAYAAALGYVKIVDLVQETLSEEENAAKMLEQIGESIISEQGGMEEDEESEEKNEEEEDEK